MKLCLFLIASGLIFAADWDAVQRIPAAQRIEVTERSGGRRLRATLVSASPDTVIVREASGERSIPRADIRELRGSSGCWLERARELAPVWRHVSAARVRVAI
jgi:hypothetical protein